MGLLRWVTAVVDGNVSVDGGYAQRRVITVVVGRLVVGRTVKRGAEGVDGVALEAESDVGRRSLQRGPKGKTRKETTRPVPATPP